MNLSSKSLFLGLGAVIAILLFSGVLTYQNTRNLRADAVWLSHTHDVIEALQSSLNTVTDAETGQRILPVYYEDNYFSLLPGESRRIHLECGPVAHPEVTLDGWNVKPATILPGWF